VTLCVLQFCTASGFCAISFNQNQDQCTQNSDCDVLSVGGVELPMGKRMCCSSYGTVANLYCEKYDNNLVELLKNSARSANLCADTNCIEFKSAATRMSVSALLPAIALGLLSLVQHF
jgi:hypothetical protein